MDSKLQELTDKIYTEGVEKGKEEAAKIVEKANAEAKAIVAKAKAEAEKKAAELDKNTKSELKLFADQAVNALKSEITDLLCEKIASDSIKAATADKAFMQKIIADICAEWVKNGEVTIEAKDSEALTNYFKANAKGLLDKGVKISETNGIKTDFAIVPAEGDYKITFGEAEFIAYFKAFLRPKLIELLF